MWWDEGDDEVVANLHECKLFPDRLYVDVIDDSGYGYRGILKRVADTDKYAGHFSILDDVNQKKEVGSVRASCTLVKHGGAYRLNGVWTEIYTASTPSPFTWHAELREVQS